MEGLIFAQPEPVSIETLKAAIPEAPTDTIRSVVDELEREYEQRTGIRVVKVAGGLSVSLSPERSSVDTRDEEGVKPSRLSRAALKYLP